MKDLTSDRPPVHRRSYRRTGRRIPADPVPRQSLSAGFEDIPADHYEEALAACFRFINGDGEEAPHRAPPTRRPTPA